MIDLDLELGEADVDAEEPAARDRRPRSASRPSRSSLQEALPTTEYPIDPGPPVVKSSEIPMPVETRRLKGPAWPKYPITEMKYGVPAVAVHVTVELVNSEGCRCCHRS